MKLVTSNFKLATAKRFKDSVGSNSATYYVFVGKSTPYANDNSVPTIEDNISTTLYTAYSEMLYGKRLAANDACLMIPKTVWEVNTVYDQYDDQIENFFETQFYVVNSNNAVFKCLNNVGGSPSLNEPVVEDPSDQIYETADGYQWKYMYTANAYTVSKFGTSSFFPFVENANVAANAIAGAISTIVVESQGVLKYIATGNGTIEQVSIGGNNQILQISSVSSDVANIYADSILYLVSGPGAGQQRSIIQYDSATKQVLIDEAFDTAPVAAATTYKIAPKVVITGDGSGAYAYAQVAAATSFIEKIIVTNTGAGYTYATAEITGYTTLSANDSNVPVLRVIMPPAGGHGANQSAELHAAHVAVATTFASGNSSGAVVDKNDFRVAGLLESPLYANVLITLTNEYNVSEFNEGEYIDQQNTNAFGLVADIYSGNNTIKLTNVGGVLNTTEPITGRTTFAVGEIQTITGQSVYFDQTLRLIATNKTNVTYFIEDEIIEQPTNNVSAIFYSSSDEGNTNSTTIKLTNVEGTFNSSDILTEWTIVGNTTAATANIQSQILPDLVHGSGSVTYIENMLPITKNSGQTETFKFIFEF